jgi:hypothetical protein
VHRNQERGSPARKAVAYVAASVVAGVVSGGVLGFAGSHVEARYRFAFATAAGAAAWILAALQIGRRDVRPLQCDRETPQRWLHAGPYRWALRNGISLGCGATRRVGFWLWYAVPLGALLSGSTRGGAILYGAFSITRSLAAPAILVVATRRTSWDYSDWLPERFSLAQRVSTTHMALCASTVLVTFG